ncbi:MAG: hypothetical protein JNN15_18345, partial [Blastocatellia bacterium]|nr:hypothetical protein [Blastocatellia bacterium]
MKLNKDSYSKLKLKRLCAAFEVIVFITPILWMVWAVPSLSKGFYPYAPLTLLTFIFALPIMSHLHHQENYQDLGFGLFNIKQGFSEL